MPDLVEQMYCSQQIFIPPNLPSILKKYAKAAIRTQPGDLLIWSSAYFRALAAGIPPPAKERIEYPPVGNPSGLSPGFLKVLINQIGKGETISKDVLEERWRGVCLSVQALQDLLAVGMFGDEVHWLEFLAICAGTLQPNLTKTMMQLCELLTEEPEGGSAAIPVSTFLNLYKYLAKLDCGPVNTLEQYEETLKEDSETQCAAEVLEPQEEEVETGVPNIDWDTAIGDDITEGGPIVEDTKSENLEPEREAPLKDEEHDPETIDADLVTIDGEPPSKDGEDVDEGKTANKESSELESQDVVDSEAGTADVNGNEGIELEAAGDLAEGDLVEADTTVPVKQETDGSEKEELEGDNADPGSETPPADTIQDPEGATEDGTVSEQNDEQTNDDAEKDGASPTGETDEEPHVVKTASKDVGAVPAERSGTEEGNVEEEEGATKNQSENDHPEQMVESQNGPPREIPQDSVKESGGETDNPESPDRGEISPTDPERINEETKPTTVEDQLGANDENVVESNGDVPVGANNNAHAMDVEDETHFEDSPGEPKADEADHEEEQKTDPMVNIGSVYIIDDDGTLSAPRPFSASANDDGKDEGDLRERDSCKTIATNASDIGMMVWPEIQPEKEEVEAEPVMEKEVTSDAGIEVLTDVDIQPTTEEIKILPEKSEETQPESAGNEENIFAPQIDSFTELLEAESAPAEEFSPEELAAAEGLTEGQTSDDVSRQMEPVQSQHRSEDPNTNMTHSTERTEVETQEDSPKAKSDRKPKKDADIESLVKKDSEMMLLPTPVTSDIMLYVDNECDKGPAKVSPSQQLANKMSLVDVQVAVPVDETVVEVVERHRYPKWMNIPGIGPIVPEHVIEEAEKYFLKVSELQEGMVMPRNIKHFHCPPLELNPECTEDERKWSTNSSVH